VQWAEKDRMLKLSFPVLGENLRYVGQVAYGVANLPDNGDEAVASKWVAVIDGEGRAFTCINDGVYGSDFSADGLRPTLLRSPAYAGHPIGDRVIVPQDRFTARIDQGERLFGLWIAGGPAEDRLAAIDREALVHNQRPMALSFFPSGGGEAPGALLTLSDDVVQCSAVKRSEDGKALIVRLFEPTGRPRATTVGLPGLGIRKRVKLGAFEVKTLRIDMQSGSVRETDLLEQVE